MESSNSSYKCTLLFIHAVFGFLQTLMAESERGQGYPLEIGYIKRPPSVNQLIRGQITVEAGGTAGECVHVVVWLLSLLL